MDLNYLNMSEYNQMDHLQIAGVLPLTKFNYKKDPVPLFGCRIMEENQE